MSSKRTTKQKPAPKKATKKPASKKPTRKTSGNSEVYVKKKREYKSALELALADMQKKKTTMSRLAVGDLYGKKKKYSRRIQESEVESD